MLRLRLTPAYTVALLALMFLTQELRMSLRTVLFRWACGGWGTRSFTDWDTCADCTGTGAPLSAAYVGAAVLPFVQMWLGYWLLGENRSGRQKASGFALVFAALPLARLTSATLAAGPEAYALHEILGEYTPSWLLAILLVLVLVVPPSLRAHDALPYPRRGALFLALLAGPLLVNAVVISGLLDPLLRAGIGVGLTPWQAPWLTAAWAVLMSLVVGLTYRHLWSPQATGQSASAGSVAGVGQAGR